MKFRRQRRRSAWNWATRGKMEIQDTSQAGTPLAIDNVDLLPSGRVDWLLENGRGREHLTVTGILLWLDFFIVNTNASIEAIPAQVDFWIVKSLDDGTNTVPALADRYQPYAQPQLPALMTTWEGLGPDENDGLDPYLWTHTIVPGSFYRSFGTTNGYEPVISPFSTTTTNILNASPLAVRGGWQPDVHVKTKRRLKKREGLAIGFGIPSSLGNNLLYSFQYSCRLLTSL